MQTLRGLLESPKSYVYEKPSSRESRKRAATTSESAAMLNLEDLTDYKIVYIAIFGDPGNRFKLLILLVGERGFEPPTPWSRTRCSTRLSHSPNLGCRSVSLGRGLARLTP